MDCPIKIIKYAVQVTLHAPSNRLHVLPIGVRTRADGRPATPPVISAVRQLPQLHMHLTFRPPDIPNGKM